MEQNKTLFVILSVALFLAAILGIGSWFFYGYSESPGRESAALEPAAVTAGDPIEWVRRNEIPSLTPQNEESQADLIIVYGEETQEPEAPSPAVSAPQPPALPPPAVVP
ncbi:MAG: hypothetical protein FWG35_04955, partial [Spirochaetaceae bacterium]|nr:hypothetical protein [Spirochaetaceae bacterium]